MIFAAPYYANAIWLVLIYIIFVYWALRKRREALRLFAQDNLLKEIAASTDFKRKIIKAVVVMVALLSSIVALMRPQWG
ncbi:MAG: hypothetical protein JW800_03795, partial [Candidatus Omnitrophica bacterium]|nr:hypothetical protein [Candidatus Omnitrophota bacterium]